LTYGRIGIAASGVGMAQATFDHSVDRLMTRQAFGKKIAQFEHSPEQQFPSHAKLELKHECRRCKPAGLRRCLEQPRC
jgi:alkylation response protein AidB-like acyl-CoA dehydrogenase